MLGAPVPDRVESSTDAPIVSIIDRVDLFLAPVFATLESGMQRRFFTVREANELIPFLSSKLTELRRVHHELQLAACGAPSGQEIMFRGGTPVPPRYLGLIGDVQELVSDVCSQGCHLKDMSSGLVDFPTIWEGREVYLCWKLGETKVGYWHEVEAGFAGRQSLEIEPDL
jgi:hypothetical protein